MEMNMYDLYLILNVFHSKGVVLWVVDVYDYVILFCLYIKACDMNIEYLNVINLSITNYTVFFYRPEIIGHVR